VRTSPEEDIVDVDFDKKRVRLLFIGDIMVRLLRDKIEIILVQFDKIEVDSLSRE